MLSWDPQSAKSSQSGQLRRGDVCLEALLETENGNGNGNAQDQVGPIFFSRCHRRHRGDTMGAEASKSGKPGRVKADARPEGNAKRSVKPLRKKKGAKYGVTVLDTPTGNIRDEYDFGKVLGEGSFGVCVLGTQKRTGQHVAIKTISKGKLVTQDNTQDIRNEILVMEAVRGHANVVKIFGAYEDENNVYIVLELCKGGDLFERIVSKGKYSEKDCADLCRQMLRMLDHCHSRGVVHRDLKPENFLLDVEGDAANLKATDFGLSCFFKPPAELTEQCGTPMYIAPEVIKGKYDHRADIWSAGVVLYIMLSGKVPFYGKSDRQILKMTLRGKFNIEKDPWPYISKEAKECVCSMLTMDPALRPDAKAMLAHPWIREDGVASDKPLVTSVLDNLNSFNQMNKFKKKALQVMATNMSVTALEEARKAFDEVDVDRSGTITLEEMKDALHKLGKKLGESELTTLWSAFDIDGNGTIDYEEFLAATTDLRKINTADNFRYAFKKFDKDNDGSITVEEVFDALKDIGVEETHARQFVLDADLNNDGVIDYDEFVTMMTQRGGIEEASNKVRNKNIKNIANNALKSELA
eukprot:Plantae.Rhodophyta-Purpureofilum_apyrenoidigerum.ctg2499.p1 GENE.Plantae.Rhodophyta-Purpureofilum_apyrenoidigerum.ctg2499~~Plantae.Rhodophyta-Purpureofilum_apyrenoidigerum.ctg2499.p1  ORF type:complete len:582 (-),score=168.87 Plantae.Rhodophyta-Purpureofilum_apyrenoidigerum.ctg2499:141-1886(-)